MTTYANVPRGAQAPASYDGAGTFHRGDDSADASPGTLPVVLLGRDHTELGQIAGCIVSDQAGIALSRGAVEEASWHLDPNEDAALAGQGRSGWLLAVADGHHGADAAEAALEGVAAACPALDDDWSSTELLVAWAIDAARSAVADRLRDVQGSRRASRTALSVAAVAADEVCVATYGDTQALRVRGRRVKSLSASSAFLGPRSPGAQVRTARLRRRDLVVLATSGLTKAVGGDLGPMLTEPSGGAPPAHKASQLATRALELEAAANVTAVVWSRRTRTSSW